MLKPVYKQRNSGEGPLENLSGPGGRGARKKSRKGKLNEKKILARQLTLKNIHAME